MGNKITTRVAEKSEHKEYVNNDIFIPNYNFNIILLTRSSGKKTYNLSYIQGEWEITAGQTILIMSNFVNAVTYFMKKVCQAEELKPIRGKLLQTSGSEFSLCEWVAQPDKIFSDSIVSTIYDELSTGSRKINLATTIGMSQDMLDQKLGIALRCVIG